MNPVVFDILVVADREAACLTMLLLRQHLESPTSCMLSEVVRLLQCALELRRQQATTAQR